MAGFRGLLEERMKRSDFARLVGGINIVERIVLSTL